MFGQNFDSSNLSAISESLQKTEALSDAEREDFFNAIHNVQLNTTNAYNTLLDIAVAADDPEMMQTMGGLVDRSYKMQGFAQAAYADQFPAQADAMEQGRQDYANAYPKETEVSVEDELDPDVAALLVDPEIELEVAAPENAAVILEAENEKPDFEKLFNDLVPAMGNCSTIGGELIRAFNKLEYRFFNDGDTIGFGYGNETCNAPARFLMQETNAEIKNLIEEHWGLDGDNDDAEYRQFIETLKTKIVDFVLDNKLDKVPNYKNLDYLNFYEKEDSEAFYDDYEDESDEALDDKGLHAPYRKTEDDAPPAGDGSSATDVGGDAGAQLDAMQDSVDSMDSGDSGMEDVGDSVVEDAEDGISDLIDDAEVHELAPDIDDIVIHKQNPELRGKVLSVHDDTTLDIKWDNDDITRNTAADDVQVVQTTDEYKYKVYYMKDGKLVKVVECIKPEQALDVFNKLKTKLPALECFYVSSNEAEQDLIAKYSMQPVNEDTILNDETNALLGKLQEELKTLYRTNIENGELICIDAKDNKAIINCTVEQPFEISVQIEMADGDTSEVVNYLYDGIAPTADFITATFSGEVQARSIDESRKTEAKIQKFYIRRAGTDPEQFVCEYFDSDSNFTLGWAVPLETGNFPIKHKFATEKDAQAYIDNLNKARAIANLEPEKAEIIEDIPPKSTESVDEVKTEVDGLDPELTYKIKTKLLTKHPEASLAQLQAAFATSYYIHTGVKPDEKQLDKVFESVEECGTVADLGCAPILPASNGKGLAKVVVTKKDDSETKRLMEIIQKNESLETETDKAALANELKQVQAATGQDLVSIIDFLSEAEFRNISQVFGTADSEEIANEIEGISECKVSKNEDSANFMQFIVDAVNAVDGFTAELDDKQGIHISSGDKKASAFYDPASRNVIAVYPTKDGEFTNAEIDLKDPKEVANQLLKPLSESMNPLAFVPDAPITAFDDKAQFDPKQALELSKADTINNDAQQKLTYRNQELPPLEKVEEEPKDAKDPYEPDPNKVGFIPLDPVSSDLNQEVFTAAVVAVSDAVKLTDNVEAFVKLQALYPNVESKKLAEELKIAKELNNNARLIKLVYDSANESELERVKLQLSEAYGQDVVNSVNDLMNDFDLTKAKDLALFKEQAKMIISNDDIIKIVEAMEKDKNESDPFIDPKLNDANSQGAKRANGQPLATTIASGNDPVTPTLADDIDPAQVVVDGIPADQSEIDAVTGKDPDKDEPDFDALNNNK